MNNDNDNDSKPPLHKREPVLVYHGSAMTVSAAQLELLHLPLWLHTLIVVVAYLMSAAASRQAVVPKDQSQT